MEYPADLRKQILDESLNLCLKTDEIKTIDKVIGMLPGFNADYQQSLRDVLMAVINDKVKKNIQAKDYLELYRKHVILLDAARQTETLTELLHYYLAINDIINIIDTICNILIVDANNVHIKIISSILSEFMPDQKQKREVIAILNCYMSRINTPKIKNILLNEIEILEKKVKLSSKPREIAVVLTTDCNLKCVMCNVCKNKYYISDILIEYIKKSMPYLEKIVWQGGEILLYKNIKDLLHLACKYNVEQRILTNGLLLDENKIKFIYENKIALSISIDAADKDKYEQIRTGADYNKLIEVLSKIREMNFLEADIDYTMPVVVMSKNYKDIEKLVDFAVKYGFRSIYFQKYIGDAKNPLSLNEQQEIEVVDKINSLINKKLPIYINTNLVKPFEKNINIPKPQEESKDNRVRQTENAKSDKLFCLAPWKTIFFDIDGQTGFSCYCDRVSVEGDLWNSDSIIKYRQSILDNALFKCCNVKCRNAGDDGRFIRKMGMT